MADKKTFVFYDTWAPMFETLDTDMAGELIKAICSYRRDRSYRPENVFILAMFEMIRQTMEEDEKRYEEVCQMRSELGKKGAESKHKQKVAKGSKSQQEVTKASKSKQKEANDGDNDIDNDIDMNNINNNISHRFSPPTVEEIRSYCKERNNNVDPVRFHDFYASKGWMVGKNPMKDWKACVRTWERGSSTTPGAKVQSFPNRDYDFDELEKQLVRNG